MKKFFSKIFDVIRQGIAWLLAIPFILSVILLVFFGFLVGITSLKVFEKLGCKINSFSSSSENNLDAKIKDYEELKKSLEELLEKVEKGNATVTSYKIE